MANYSVPARRLFPAAVLALAVVGAPVVAVMAMPGAVVSTPLAACTSGEEEDVYTTSCVPMLVPNSPDDAVSPRTRPIPTSLRSTASRAPATTAVPASGWPRSSRRKGRSRFRDRPSAPARSQRPYLTWYGFCTMLPEASVLVK